MNNNTRANIAIIGAGPSGVYCALWLNKFKCGKIDIYEKSSPLKTLLHTGGGRCNMTHYAHDITDFVKNYPRGEKFLYSLFTRHFVDDSLSFFKSVGIDSYMQDDERYFPKSNSAADMREKMLSSLKNVKIIKKNVTNIIELNKNYDYIIISTGSKGGYELAKSIGHKIIPPKPALCGLKLAAHSPKYPQGVVLNTSLGDILFTKDGISGPYVYKLSSINARKNFPYSITVPLIDTNELTYELQNNPKKSFGNIVSKFIPKSIAHALLGAKYNTNCANVSKKQVLELQNITFDIISTDNKGEIVTSGGIDLREINKYCQSKLDAKYFFCGEIMDIDGFCGGYNLQSCWSSAYCVARRIAELMHKIDNLAL